MNEKNIFGAIASVFGTEEKAADIKFDRTIDGDGYTVGGDSGNLHVVQCEAYIAYIHQSKKLLFNKKDIGVKPMICIGKVKSPEIQAKLEEIDPNTPSDRVLIVNKKFMSPFTFTKWQRVAILEGYSTKANVIDAVDVLEQADVAKWCAARENHLNFTVESAFKKVDKDLNKQCKKFASVTKRELKKGANEPGFNRIVG